jgi:hypothetical protein
LAVVHSAIKDSLPRHNRARHLVALPVVGTGDLAKLPDYRLTIPFVGAGGFRNKTGEMLRCLLRLLYEGAKKYEFDIALVSRLLSTLIFHSEPHSQVCWDEPTFSAAQRARMQLVSSLLAPIAVNEQGYGSDADTVEEEDALGAAVLQYDVSLPSPSPEPSPSPISATATVSEPQSRLTSPDPLIPFATLDAVTKISIQSVPPTTPAVLPSGASSAVPSLPSSQNDSGFKSNDVPFGARSQQDFHALWPTLSPEQVSLV